MLVINSDSHGVEILPNIRYGVATARRGWVSAAQVANARPWKELDKLRKRGAAKPARRGAGRAP
jgi:DNA polymerase (family 10)